MMHRIAAFAVTAASLCGSALLAHDPIEGSTVFSVQVPDERLAGSIIQGTLIAPPAGLTILHAELDLTFRPMGTTTAREVELTFSIGVDGRSRHWTVTGADLGWGTGAGIFRGRIDTDRLFGQIEPGFPGPVIRVTLRSVTGGGLDGRFTSSFLRLTLSGSLRRGNVEVSASLGGVQQLDLDAGVNHAGERYLLVGSFAGTLPGIPLGAVTLPLNLDPYLLYTAANPNQLIVGSLGTLDGSGRASARFVLPAGVANVLVGLEAHHAYVTVDGEGTIRFASAPATVRFTN